MIRSISVSAGLAIVLICSAAAAQSSALPAPLSIEDALQLARREPLSSRRLQRATGIIGNRFVYEHR